MSTPTDAFVAARDLLLRHRTDPEAAGREFSWPRLEQWNWALDWFDVFARGNARPALRVVEEDGRETVLSFAELSGRSNRVARHLRSLGARPGDRILLVLGNGVALFELLLASIKLGLVVIPATTLLTADDLRDRVARGRVTIAALEAELADRASALEGVATRLAVGGQLPGFLQYEDAHAEPAAFEPDAPTRAGDLLLVYFTSGTTSRPKLVGHTHASYPVGHLSTLYWIGLREGDVHLNVSSPGWAKHAWSSFFAPWNAGATVVVQRTTRFNAAATLELIVRAGVTTFCAPPTVWRLLVQHDLAKYAVRLREVVGAGEPLNPEVIERVRRAWGLTIRDGYGQTETTAQIGNTPGVPVDAGSMGRPLPGYSISLLDHDGHAADQGEIALALEPRPLALMCGYVDDAEKTTQALAGGFYRTGDVASRDASGRFWFVGRSDDVFKSSDYRISPFELESALVEHAAIGEAACVPSPDPIRLAVPKAFVAVRAGFLPSAELARDVLRSVNARLAPYKRIRRIEFAELPKTISGKIRRVELREREQRKTERAPLEFWEEDFPELRARG